MSGKRVVLNLEFIDSAEVCTRTMMRSINLLCFGVILAAIAGNPTILSRVPYGAS